MKITDGDFSAHQQGNLRQTKRPTPQSDRIMHLVDEWFSEFCEKSSDYQTSTGNVSENFGLMGQYMKLTDKIHKLRKPMWDDEVIEEIGRLGHDLPADVVKRPDFHFESTEEILRDIIGHCFLALDFIEQKAKEDRAKEIQARQRDKTGDDGL